MSQRWQHVDCGNWQVRGQKVEPLKAEAAVTAGSFCFKGSGSEFGGVWRAGAQHFSDSSVL